MTNKNKLKLLISSIVILLPSFAALILKDHVDSKVMGAWHFGWVLPLVLVAMHVILHLLTFRENEKIGQNKKIVEITYWIMPALSVYVSAIFMMLSLGLENALGVILCVLFGAMFIVMGNYMPKSLRNRTFGFKVKWTLANDENWVATHRLAGKVWVASGIVVLLGAFLPETASIILLIVTVIPAVFVPMIYSYSFYRNQLRKGTATKEDYSSYPENQIDKKTGIIATVIGVLIVIGVMVMMFVGSISFTVADDSLDIDTTYGGGISVDYDEIQSVEYVTKTVPGMRVSGFASSKLLFGWFKNDELGNYTRYTYTNVEAGIIIRTADKILVIADESVETTKALYDAIAERIYGE